MPDITILKSLNRAYRQQPVAKADFNTFKRQLKIFYEQIETVDTEEKMKGDLMDFLKLTFYGQDYKVSPNGKIDCAIHLGNSVEAHVGVIFEVKMPTNVSEMAQRGNLNRKAVQELLLYWLRERVSKRNIALKKLIVTNIYEYFIFDAQEFERAFFSNKKLLKRFDEFNSGVLTSEKTDFFYKEIAAPCIAEVADSLEYTWFDIRDYRKALDRGDDRRIISLYKVFSPENLLKKPFQTDSNKLNVKFYSELLYIIGLEEIEDKEGSKRIIARKKTSERNRASLIESTITILDSEDWLDRVEKLSRFGADRNEQLFNVALFLVINWVNRILFMKLLEAQMLKYHKGDVLYAFMKPQLITDYDELNKLFFQVLAKRPQDRQEHINAQYGRIPYLNSSLFELSPPERQTIRISNLEDSEMPLFSGTVLREGNKPRHKTLSTLRYLLEFLDAYDFSSEGADEIHENAKTLINASVLGLIFEKINGHKDGSVFTPGAITMWMSRETLKRAVVRKFNEAMGWTCRDYDALRDKDIDDIRYANEIMDSLRICDPSVGSGHFLVSVLNEIIWIKYDLGILTDPDGRRIKKQDYSIVIENDELMVSDEEGNPFSYIPGNAESQRIQETLFIEKRKIIENCLFGVDLNPNAVTICRLRLWIELLKNAFYTKDSGFTELETLPNIDINIKVGNSLLHKFGLDQDISEILRKTGLSIGDYRRAVGNYKNAHNKEEKRELDELIRRIKIGLKTEISHHDPLLLRKTALNKELYDLEAPELFEVSRKVSVQNEKKKKALRGKIAEIQKELDEIRDNRIYIEAFEWRIEFPEVLDEDGRFIGFDCIIGNPPYIQLQKMGSNADALAKMSYSTYERTGDIYCLFYELGHDLLKPNGELCFITSNKWMRAGYGEKTRAFLTNSTNPLLLIDFAGVKVFENATVDTNILLFSKSSNSGDTLCAVAANQSRDVINNMSDFLKQTGCRCAFAESGAWVVLSEIEQSIKKKIEVVGKPLKGWDINIYRGILTGYNDAFIITTEKRDEILSNCKDDEERSKTSEIIRPILRGRDIKRYSYEWSELWLIATFPSKHYDIEQYPAIKEYLLSFGMERLEQTGKEYVIDGQHIKARKKTNNKWFETQDSISYWEDFGKQKIVWIELTDESKFALSSDSIVLLNTVFFMIGEHIKYLLAVINSNLIHWYYLNSLGATSGVGTNRWLKYTVECIPVPILDEYEAVWNSIVDKTIENHTNGIDASSLESQIDEMVYSIYGLSEDEITYVQKNRK